MIRARALSLFAALALAGCAGKSTTPPSNTAVVLAADTEAAMREVPIAMYMTTWCPVCTHARDWMRERGYRFVEYDIEEDARARLILRELNPRGSVPMFDVDGMIVIGFDPRMMQSALRRAVQQRRSGTSGYGEAAPDR